MIQLFFALFLALMPHNTKTIKATTVTTQTTLSDADDTGGETEHAPNQPPKKP